MGICLNLLRTLQYSQIRGDNSNTMTPPGVCCQASSVVVLMMMVHAQLYEKSFPITF